MGTLYNVSQSVKTVFPRGSLGWRILRTPLAVYFWSRGLWRRASKNGVFNNEFEMISCSLEPYKTIQLVIDTYQPKSVLDLGCGTGKSLDYLLSHGIDCWGIEASPLAISKANNPQRIRQLNICKPFQLDRKYDLVWSYEVAEHIHPDFVDNLMTIFTTAADRVVLSAARPGQGGEGHFNEQPPEYWIALFDRYGFDLDRSTTEALHGLHEAFSDNMLAFRKRGAP